VIQNIKNQVEGDSTPLSPENEKLGKHPKAPQGKDEKKEQTVKRNHEKLNEPTFGKVKEESVFEDDHTPEFIEEAIGQDSELYS
jgi:hypothetical protein